MQTSNLSSTLHMHIHWIICSWAQLVVVFGFDLCSAYDVKCMSGPVSPVLSPITTVVHKRPEVTAAFVEGYTGPQNSISTTKYQINMTAMVEVSVLNGNESHTVICLDYIWTPNRNQAIVQFNSYFMAKSYYLITITGTHQMTYTCIK